MENQKTKSVKERGWWYDNPTGEIDDNLTLNVFKDKKSLEKIQTKDGSEGSWYKAYKKAFPIKDERENPEGFLDLLKDSRDYPEWQDYIIMSIEDGDKVVGGATANRLTGDDYTIAVFEYLFVDKAYRGKGLVNALTEARLDEVQIQADTLDSKFVATLAEIENLEKMSSEDRKEVKPEDIKSKRKLLNRLGYKVVDMPYVQLPLDDEGFEHVHHLDLLIRPTDEKKGGWKNHIPSKDLKTMLGMYAETFTDDFEKDPEYKKMMDYLSKREKIPLKSLI